MFDKFKDKFPFPKDKWDEYVSYYNRIEVPARTILLKEGAVSKKAFMIEKGCLRLWFNNQGKDITFQFFLKTKPYHLPRVSEKIYPVFLPLKLSSPQ